MKELPGTVEASFLSSFFLSFLSFSLVGAVYLSSLPQPLRGGAAFAE